MRIIKVPKQIQLRYKHPTHLSLKTQKLLKINTDLYHNSILPPLKQHPTLYSNHKYSAINLGIASKNIRTSTHKITLPYLNNSTSSEHKQTCFSNESRKPNIHSTFQPKKLSFIPRQIHSITLPGLHSNDIPKQNQDAFIIIKNIFNNSHYDIIGILDGHGNNGHLVSEFLKNEIESYFLNHLIFPSKLSHIINSKLIKDNFSFLRTFILHLQNMLIHSSNINIEFSGSTCVLVFVIENNIIVLNIGDSRAIIVSRSYKGNIFVEQMSTDHKPELPKEKERIVKAKGEVFREYGDEPYRVWCKGKDYPGIAMSRSLGDIVAKGIGVCCEPEIIMRNISKDNMYIIVASDGLWDVLTNKEVEEIVSKFYYKNDIEGACEELLEQAKKKYENEYENGRDDITFVIYFFSNKKGKYVYTSSTTLMTNASQNKLM